jgi:type II secretory pathway pseudopilin PulG
MKRHLKSSILGVTLLEIMLVLAIAAMVIVMSVRYYQSASTSSQSNAGIEMIQAITAAADSLAQASGSYNSASASQITSIAGAHALALPWGGTATIAPTTTNYVVNLGTVPTATCTQITLKLKTNTHYSLSSNCGTYLYTP